MALMRLTIEDLGDVIASEQRWWGVLEGVGPSVQLRAGSYEDLMAQVDAIMAPPVVAAPKVVVSPPAAPAPPIVVPLVPPAPPVVAPAPLPDPPPVAA